MPQVVGHVLGRRVPLRGPLRQRLEANAFQFLRDRVVPLPGRTNFHVRDLLQQFLSCLRRKRSPPGQQFVQHHAQAENVAAAIDPVALATGLLWTHVGGRPGVAWPPADILLPQGQAEIRHERFAAVVEQDVAGLDVPVDQPLAVGVVQRLGHRRCEFRRFRHGGPVRLDALGQGAAVDELRDDEAGVILGAAHVVDGNDVRVVQAGDGAGFGPVGFGVFGPGDEPAVRHFDGHEPLQLLVVGEENPTETALAQDSLDPEAADAPGLLGGDFIGGIWLVRAGAVEVDHGWCNSGACVSGLSSVRRIIPAPHGVRHRRRDTPTNQAGGFLTREWLSVYYQRFVTLRPNRDRHDPFQDRRPIRRHRSSSTRRQENWPSRTPRPAGRCPADRRHQERRVGR